MKRFQDKVIIVTGATSGMGRAAAVAFAAEGARVVVGGRRQPEGEETVTMIKKAGGQGMFVHADVSREADVEQLVNRTVERFGRLDVAFNNAGTGGRGFVPITEVTANDFEEILGVNLRSVAFGMKHEITAMLESGGGTIVNNASITALRPLPQLPLYSASKAAVVTLTKAAALEVAAKGVRVNAVCPATIETEMTAPALRDPAIREHLRAMHPVGRFGQAEEVAAAVLYLCSDEARFVTGVALPVDGGFAA